MENRARKAALRRETREILSALPQEARDAASRLIGGRLALTGEYEAADTVFFFVGTDWEIDTLPMIWRAIDRGKRVCVPRCASKGMMEASEIKGPDDLEPGRYFGILEPKSHCGIIPPGEINFAVLPCVSCDREGNRLGYGGGYYDRYLRGTGFSKAAICRDALLRSALPVDTWDVPVDMVITETEVFRRKDG